MRLQKTIKRWFYSGDGNIENNGIKKDISILEEIKNVFVYVWLSDVVG